MKGYEMPKKVQWPTKEWLEAEWLLPPRGKGRGSPDIAKELGVSKRTVLRWVEVYEIQEDIKERRSAHRRGKQNWSKERPSKEELSNLYFMPPRGRGLSLIEIGKHYQVNSKTVRGWIRYYDIVQPFSDRHSQRMAGKGNASYKNGESNRYHQNVLRRSDKPKRCIWCKTTDDLQVHHINHDKTNGSIENLEWLCGPCNRLESNLWALSSRVNYEFTEEDGIIRELRIKFST